MEKYLAAFIGLVIVAIPIIALNVWYRRTTKPEERNAPLNDEDKVW